MNSNVIPFNHYSFCITLCINVDKKLYVVSWMGGGLEVSRLYEWERGYMNGRGAGCYV